MQNLKANANNITGTVPLGELCQKIRGVSYSKTEVVSSPRKDYLPILRANNIDNEELNYKDLVYVPKERVAGRQLLQKGDVVIAMSSGSKKLVGKAAQLKDNWEGSFGAFCGVLRPDQSKVDPDYFGYYFGSATYRQYISDVSAGTNINNLKNEHFESILMPLPTLDKQKEIASQLGDLIPEVNVNKARLYKAKRLVQDFKKAVLNAAVTGELTKNWRINKPDLRVDSYKKVERDIGFYPEIPKSWIYSLFSNCTVKITDGTHHSPQNFPTGEFKYITAKNIKEWGLDMSNLTYVDAKTHKEIYARCDVKKDDLLYIKDGVTAGIATVNSLDEEFSLLSSVGVLRFEKEKILPDYVCYFLNSPIIRRIMLDQVAGVAITRLTLTKIKGSLLAIPPFEEQEEIVRIVRQNMEVANKVEKNIEAAEKNVSKLTQTILAKTFSQQEF